MEILITNEIEKQLLEIRMKYSLLDFFPAHKLFQNSNGKG